MRSKAGLTKAGGAPAVALLTLEQRLSRFDPAKHGGEAMASKMPSKESDSEKAWAEEVERRHAEIDGGAVSLLSGEEALV
jgi:hypothetical protein